MKSTVVLSMLGLAACGSSDSGQKGGAAGTSGGAGTSGAAGSHGGAGASGSSGNAGTTGGGGAGTTGAGGAGGAATDASADAIAAGDGAAGADAGADASVPPDGSAATCTAARAQLLGAIDKVATGAVTIVDDTSGVRTVVVDATAGGAPAAATNPWIFVDLATANKVAVSDVTATSSTAWDVAFKRANIYGNGGQGGPGQGGAVLVTKEFSSVTASDAAAATLKTESFFDAQCNPNLDEAGAAKTSFTGWYAYDEATHQLGPAPGTWIVRGGTGHLYKLAIETYYAAAPGSDAGTGASGTYRLKIAAL